MTTQHNAPSGAETPPSPPSGGVSDIQHEPRLQLIESIHNPENDSARIVYKFTKHPEMFLVVKLFDRQSGQNERWTSKVWFGDYESVKQHWGTQIPYELEDKDYDMVNEALINTIIAWQSVTEAQS